MVNQNVLNKKIDKIDAMLIQLRDDMFFEYKKMGNKGLDRFNEVSWELGCLKNLVNELCLNIKNNTDNDKAVTYNRV